MHNEKSLKAMLDKFTLLGRLTGKIGHSANNAISGASGLISLAMEEEEDASEKTTDLEEAAHALTPAGLMIRRALEIAISNPGERTETFGMLLERLADLTGALTRIRLTTDACPSECLTAAIPVDALEHCMLAALVMISDRSRPRVEMTVESSLRDGLHVRIEGAGLASSPLADQLDDLQQPVWEYIMSQCSGTVKINKTPGRIEVEIFCPAVHS